MRSSDSATAEQHSQARHTLEGGIIIATADVSYFGMQLPIKIYVF